MNNNNFSIKKHGGSRLLTSANILLIMSWLFTLLLRFVKEIPRISNSWLGNVEGLYYYHVVVEFTYILPLLGIVLIFWISKLISKNITKKMLIINLSMTFLSVVYVVARLLWWRYAVFSQPLHP